MAEQIHFFTHQSYAGIELLQVFRMSVGLLTVRLFVFPLII